MTGKDIFMWCFITTAFVVMTFIIAQCSENVAQICISGGHSAPNIPNKCN